MPTIKDTQTQADQFMNRLRRAIRPYGPDGPIDRGTASRLRGLLVGSIAYRGLPDLAAIAGPDQLDNPVHQTIAALYALHPEEQAMGNFGTVCRTLAKDNEAAFRQRFMQILSSRERADACSAIAPVIRRAASQNVRIPWRSLFIDLSRWGNPVRIRWTQTYCDTPLPEPQPETHPSPV
jgi:CRISPR type I-E-associated protein CasB/Cse2